MLFEYVLKPDGTGYFAYASAGIVELAGVTPEQVQAVARKYFSDEQLTVATLEPLPLSAQARRAPAAPGLRH